MAKSEISYELWEFSDGDVGMAVAFADSLPDILHYYGQYAQDVGLFGIEVYKIFKTTKIYEEVH